MKVDSQKHIDGECILRLSGSTTVYLGDLQGELKTVANVNFAARYPDRVTADQEVQRQREHGRSYEVIPAPPRSSAQPTGFATRRMPAAANF
jgi:hypothetical protein